MNVLITGATGFIGQHLLEELKDDPFAIRVISRKQNPEFRCTNKKIEIYQGNIADIRSIEKAFEGVDVLINLAAELKNDLAFEATNISGIKNMIALSEKNNIKKIIHLSSVGVVGMQYSQTKVVVDENTPCHTKNEYERTKLQSEILLNTFAKKGNTEINILRPTNVFGDHHPRKSLLGFLQRVKEGGGFPASKNAMVSYVYVKDVAHALRYCLLNTIGNTTLNVGESVPFKSFLSMAAAPLNASVNIIHIPPFLFAAINSMGYFGIKKLKTNLRGISNCVEYSDHYMKNRIGYKYGISEGLKKTIAYYKLQ